MIVCDTGPIVSAINKGEKRWHLFAAELLARLGRKVIVPWPVLVETDLLIRSRGFPSAAIVFGESMATGVHRLQSQTAADLELALKLGKRYIDSGADLPDLIVMAMAHHRKAQILTWDFGLCLYQRLKCHFRDLEVVSLRTPANSSVSLSRVPQSAPAQAS